MYQRTLTLLWTLFSIFAALAIADAFLDYMGNFQGLWIGSFATCIVCICVLHATRAVTTKLLANQATSDDVHTRVEELGDRVGRLEERVGEVRDLTEGNALVEKARQQEEEARRRRQQAGQGQAQGAARIYQFPISADGHDAIVGNRSGQQPNIDEILAVLDTPEPGVNGRHSAS